MTTKLTVVVVTHDRCPLLERTLDSLGRCLVPSEYCRTVIVENGGKFGADEIVRRSSKALRAEYLYEPQASKSLALNRAVEQVRDGLVVFFDDDVRVTENVLVAYANAARGPFRNAFYGGPLSADYEQPPPDWLIQYLPGSAKGYSLEGPIQFIDRPMFGGANWAAFANDLLKNGGFVTNLGPELANAVGEDTQMQRTLLDRGIRGCYVPKALVWHYVPVERCTPKWALQRIYRHSRSTSSSLEDGSSRLLGVPRWMVRRLVESYATSLYTLFFSDRETAFQFRAECWRIRGLMRGIRDHRVEHPRKAGR